MGGHTLPEHLRHQLAKPYGPIHTDASLPTLTGPIAAVGDVVSLTLKRLGIQPALFVCDYKTQRGDDDPAYRAELGSWGDEEIRVTNPAAAITDEAWAAVKHGWSTPGTTRIVVDGEEDLLGIPAFLEAPLGATVLYGMPGQGMVVVTITKAFKDTVRALVAQMPRT